MIFEKPSTTIEQQISLLHSRGMDVSDKELVQQWLETVGYYRLSAYWLPFELPPVSEHTRSKKLKPNIRFEDVIDLYVFDRKLRLLATEAIERIEISLRSRWTNRLSLKHGAHAHMMSELFNSGRKHAQYIAALSKRAEESSEVFIEHYREKYTKPYMPPLWAVTELMTFGELSKWVASTNDARLRGALAKDLGLPTQETLIGTLQVLSYIRNICAHHARLWNRKTVKRLPNIKRFSNSLVRDDSAPEGQHQLSNRLYNVLVILLFMMRHQAADTTFPARLHELLKTRNDDQLSAMGVPHNWESLPAWNMD